MTKGRPTYKKIMNELEKHREDICKYGVKKIGLFGSFLRNEQKRGSDIDIIVGFDNVTFKKYIQLKFFLESLFGKDVDLVIEKNLRPELKYIKKEVEYARL